MSVKFTNNAETTLASGINSSVTSLTVASSSGFPTITTGEYFYVTLDDGTNNEIVKVTAVSGTTWTIVRAQDNTTARSFSSTNKVELRVTAGLITDAVADALASSFAKNAFTGDGSTTDFTLSQSPNSEDDLIVFIEGVFQNQSTYSLSGTTLTFSTAPADTRAIVVYTVKAAVSGANLNHDQFTASGSAAFTLSIAPINENNTQVFIDGVYQQKTDYAVSGTTLTFDTAPANGAIVEVMTFTQTEVNVPAADSVTTASIADNVGLGGSPTTTTQSASDNSTKIATTAYVTTAVANIIDAAPDTLNTLNEIAAALNDDANFNTTVTNSIASKMPLAGGTFTGDVTFNGTNLYFNGAASSASYNLALENSDTFTSFYGTTDATVNKGYKFYTGNQSGDLALTLDSSGNVGIGITDPDHKLEIGGAHSQLKLTDTDDDNYVQMSYSSDYLAFRMNSTTSTPVLALNDNDKVGIGVTAPAQKLEVAGRIRATTDPTFEAYEASGQRGGLQWDSTNDFLKIFSVGGDIVFESQNNSGSVGIGESDPSGYWGQANDLVIDTSGNGGITIKSTTSGNGRIAFTDTKSSTAGLNDGGLISYHHSDDAMSFQTAGDEAIRIDNTGKVGIGTNSPTTLTELRGTIPTLTLSSSESKTWSNGDDIAKISFFSRDGSGIGAHETGFILNESENSGSSLSGALVFGVADYNTAAAEAMRIDSDGNVGIGDATPEALLDVGGGYGSNTTVATFAHATDAYIEIENMTSQNGAGIILTNAGTKKWTIQKDTSAHHLTIQDTSGDVMTFTQGGKVGIGVTAPQGNIDAGGASLHIKGGSAGTPHYDTYAGLVVENGESRMQVMANNGGNQAAAFALSNESKHWIMEHRGPSDNNKFKIGYLSSSSSGDLAGHTTKYFAIDTSGNTHTMKLNVNAATSGDTESFIRADRSSDINSGGTVRFVVFTSGNVQNTNNSYGQISDIKHKENIVDATDKLDEIKQVKIKNFNFKGDDTKQIGVIAQELETIFPALVEAIPDTDEDGNDLGTETKSVKYSVFVPILIKAMQEQQALIETLQKEMEELKGG